MFYTFLWDGKPDKMRRTLAKQKMVNGGIGMLDVSLFDKALKLTWLRRFFINEAKWTEIINEIYPCFKDVKNFGNVFVNQLVGNVDNPFWKNVMTYYIFLNKQFIIRTKEELQAYSFLCNEHIKIGNREITYRDFVDSNVFFIKQLMTGTRFLTYQEFTQKYNTRVNFLAYYSVISAVKRYVSNTQDLPKNTKHKDINYQPTLNFIMNTVKGASPIYHLMLEPDNQNKEYQK